MDRFLTKNIKNGTERGWNDWKKNENGTNQMEALVLERSRTIS